MEEEGEEEKGDGDGDCDGGAKTFLPSYPHHPLHPRSVGPSPRRSVGLSLARSVSSSDQKEGRQCQYSTIVAMRITIDFLGGGCQGMIVLPIRRTASLLRPRLDRRADLVG